MIKDCRFAPKTHLLATVVFTLLIVSTAGLVLADEASDSEESKTPLMSNRSPTS